MDPAVVSTVTVLAFLGALLGIGIVASRRLRGSDDFVLGGRGLGGFVAGISASATSSSAWTLIGVSGLAYGAGLSAVWLFPACVGGFALNWYVLAPRLRAHSAAAGSLTMIEVIAGPRDRAGRTAVVRVAAAITVVSLFLYVAAQFQAAGKVFGESLDIDPTAAVLLGSAVVIVYTIAGGFWSISLNDTLQGIVMVVVALVLPLSALIAVGGPVELWHALHAEGAGAASWVGGRSDIAALGFVLALLGIGIAYPGQPHVVNFVMALRDERALRRARTYAMLWAVIVYAGMITLGLCARVLPNVITDEEHAFMATAKHLFTPVIAGVMISSVLAAILSTVDSQLLTSATCFTHDLAGGRGDVVRRSRIVILVVSAGAVGAALVGDQRIFTRVLFAWSALGAAFGPLLLMTVWRGAVAPRAAVTAMVTGFALSVAAYSYPPTRDTAWERVAPFIVAGVLAWSLDTRARRRAAMPA